MSRLTDEPFEKVIDDKDLVPAMIMVEKVVGTVQCNNCSFWGKMDGYIDPDEKRFIKFICPSCDALEFVTNPEAVK